MISTLFLFRQIAQPAKPMIIGPLKIMRLSPPCHPYSENIGSERSLGAKVTRTMYDAIDKTITEVSAKRLTEASLLIPNL